MLGSFYKDCRRLLSILIMNADCALLESIAHVIFLVSNNYSLTTGESYDPTSQHMLMQDSLIFFIQLNYVHKNKDKVLSPYGKFPCHKVAQHWEFHFLFLNSAILLSCNFGHSCLYLLKSSIFLPSINYFCWIVLVCIYRYVFRHILGFLTLLFCT